MTLTTRQKAALAGFLALVNLLVMIWLALVDKLLLPLAVCGIGGFLAGVALAVDYWWANRRGRL